MRSSLWTADSGGDLAAHDEPGDLEVRGPVVFQKYYRNQVATSQAFTPDHWFRTGDRAVIDSNGNLSLVGRVKDVININGVKMVAADIQAAVEHVLGDRVARLVVFPSMALHTEQVTVAYIPQLLPDAGKENGRYCPSGEASMPATHVYLSTSVRHQRTVTTSAPSVYFGEDIAPQDGTLV